MNCTVKNFTASVVSFFVVLSGFVLADIPQTHGQNTPQAAPTMASCTETQVALLGPNADIDQRGNFEIELHCTALVQNYLFPARYKECGLAAYDRRFRENGSVPSSELSTFEASCREGQVGNQPPANSDTQAPAAPSGGAAVSGRSGVTAPLLFTAKPRDQFIGDLTGASTQNLANYYVNPLLLVSDRQTAFRVLINFLLGLVGAVTLLFIIFNGYRYAVSRGEEAQISQAKKGIMYAVIGLLIILAAYTIVATILNFGAQPPAGSLNVGVGINL